MTIIVCPMSHAADIARQREPSHVVSLLDPNTPFPVLEGYRDEQRLMLGIHDIEVEAAGFDYLNDQHMRTILDYVGGWDRSDPMLIHCYAGISRSTATAFITACLHNPGVDEQEIALSLREVSPTASPNRRFIALADAALQRSGRMSKAIESIGRGASWLDIGEAKPFVLPSRFA